MIPPSPETVKLALPAITPLTLFSVFLELIVSEARLVEAPSVTLPAPELIVSDAVAPTVPVAPKITTPEPPSPPGLL